MAETVVVDYQAGNLRSVQTALEHLGADFAVTDRPQEVERASRLIFPGVGEARAAMTELQRTGLDAAIRGFHASGRPLLGICIGCQVVFARSEERDTRCLGILPGEVLRFPRAEGLKVPHMGWNRLFQVRPHPIFAGIPDGTFFYFVHSYYPLPAVREEILAESEYGRRFAAAVGRDNLAAVQFHPEKSGPAGLRLLANFLAWEP